MSINSTIEYRQGDLIKAFLSGEVQVMAHQCNCFNNFGAGIARQIAKEIPSAQKADNKTVKGDINKLGTFSKATIKVEYDDNTIYNLYGQYHWANWGNKEHLPAGLVNNPCTSYDALMASLKAMAFDIESNNWVVPTMHDPVKLNIGLPLIGAGLAGGDWNIIEKLIQSAFHGTWHNIIIYKYGPLVGE